VVHLAIEAIKLLVSKASELLCLFLSILELRLLVINEANLMLIGYLVSGVL